MASEKFKKIGLRRDKNLSDLSNSNESLNNILNGLVDNNLTESFISEDLDAIRSIYSYGFLSQDYRQIIGSESEETDSLGIDRPFFPRITFQNKLDRLQLFAGQPRYNGGDGLTARYYNKKDIYADTVGIFSGTFYNTDNFWEWGHFEFDNNVSKQAGNPDDGIEWEGYFVPTFYGEHTFTFDTTACIKIEFETEGYTAGIGTYTEKTRIGITTTLSANGTQGTNTISLSNPTNIKYIGIGQSVFGTGISTNSIVESYNYNTGVINLTPPQGSSTAVYSTINSANITFFKKIGQETRSYFSTYILSRYRPYRVRFKYFIPKEINAIKEKKLFRAWTSVPLQEFNRVRYQFLYSLNYDFSSAAKGDFTNFIDNSLSFGGGSIGSNTISTGYVKVKTNKKIDIKYEPKISYSQIRKNSINGTLTSGSNVLLVNNTSNIEVGNYIFGNFLQDGTTVTDIGINQFIIMSKNATNSGTNLPFIFIEHRGFVKKATGSSTSTTFTLAEGNTSLLKSDMIIIGENISSYTGITTTGSSNSFTISPSQTINANTEVYFYQSKGLINDSLSTYCIPTTTKCLLVTSLVLSGNTVIPVTNTSGIALNWKVQGFQFQSNTVINAFTTNSITINKPTIEPLNSGGNFTVTSSTEDKTLCCPPTDTSPPFNPTETGLDTVSGAPNLRIDSGNIVFSSISAEISTTNITEYVSSNSGSRLVIKTPLTTVGASQTSIFKILCE